MPMIRSGSCAEKGPKEYMEDEHICIDNLLEYLDMIEDLPALGAFYGVCISMFVLFSVIFHHNRCVGPTRLTV